VNPDTRRNISIIPAITPVRMLRDGQHVGYLTSGNYGHHLGGAIGLGYVPCVEGEKAAAQLGSEYMIDVGGQQVKARASLKPMYDPQSQRVKM